ncbi:Ran-binding protein 3 [Entomortierella parvispora]|uniref:Ran-binding protein 3 n=1 Tax=Entomortierella parvispora TaxID=205924 RepID=A0A9P3HAY5_9FUNG|nr:Ran-binding protein 3 [Entomortierella parvispora]
MSSPISRTDSPSQDEHAKRKRDEQDALEKLQGESTLSSEVENLPPKKIKPEESHTNTVSKAEVKNIQRNLKTMPLEDQKSIEGQSKDKEMDEVSESSTGEGSPQESPAQGPEKIESRPSSAASSITTTTPVPAVAETEPPKRTSGFNDTSSVSPFAKVKSGENVFSSAASPFAAVEKTTSIFDSQPASSSAFSSGFGSSAFGGDSAKSVFGADSSTSTSVFGSGSSTTKSAFGSDSSATKSVFGSEPSTTKSVFGSSSSFSSGFGQGSESTAFSVFGAKSVVGSVGNPSQAARENTSAFTSSQPTSSFGGTFGSKASFGKEASFLGDQDSQNQSQGDFGEMLSQHQAGNEDDQQEEEETEDFGTGIFTNAEQVDVQTGEEDEMNIFSTKGKLYADADKTQSWKERGKGTFKVNVGRKDTKLARLVMRADGVLRLILNIAIFPDMKAIITGDKYVRFVGVEDGQPMSFLLKVKDITEAENVVRSIARASERQLHGKGQGVVLKD